MKKILAIVITIMSVVACSRKSVPNKTTADNNTSAGSNTTVSTTTPDATEIPPVVTTRVANVRAMIIISGDGKILTPKEKLPPEENLSPDYSKIARAFTPEQKANLNLRYKTVPPKVIYVPAVYAQKSLKGTYSVYKKKFWYWKKEDGLFYLDETYYK